MPTMTTCVLWSGGKDCFAAGLRSEARFVDVDPARLREVERDGVRALAWPSTVTSDFH
jgi:diphthamide synthase (EF-2-diphthine--ammonia ligase)